MDTSQSTLIPIISPVSSLHTLPIMPGSVKIELEDVVSILEVGESTDKLRHRHTHSTGVCCVLKDRQTDRGLERARWT